MIISNLLNILSAIYDDYGDIVVELYYNKNQDSDNTRIEPNGSVINDLETIRISTDCTKVYLSNEFSYTDEYNGCSCDVRYNPDTKIYEGHIIPSEQIEGFNTSFTAYNKYDIPTIFHAAVDEYLDFMGNAKITKTLEVVKNITGEFDQDLDYGELSGGTYEASDDDDDYGEV